MDAGSAWSETFRRRRRILKHLRREGLEVLALGSTSPTKGHWGEARTELLNRTKVLLNLPRYPGHLSDRLLMGMATGALVVSEPMYLPAPFQPGVHYVESEVDEMAETVRSYLADDEARRRITDTAYTFLTEGQTLEGVFARLVELTDRAVGRARPAHG
jgi:Glycosyl transferases group 1